MRGSLVATIGLVACLVAGCSDDGTPASSRPSTSPQATSPQESATTMPDPPAEPVVFEAARALRHVRILADRIGPRLATGPAYREAAAYVARSFRQQGYDVRRQRFPVPAGDSWGVPVAAGTSFNVIATPTDFDASSPYRIVGAHLDTVAVAPGAEDNASGVSVLLEIARLATAERTRLPTVLIAFGAEEPRGPADHQHHFGSQFYVREMSRPERKNLVAMVSMDRVGVGGRVPICTGTGPPRLRDDLLAVAERLGIPANACEGNTASDHESFEDGGYDAARLGSTPYAGYHSAGDVLAVVGRAQLHRTGRVIWAWLRAR